jgi:hypothetical protein
LGKYLPHIAPTDATVIDFGLTKLSCGVAKSLSKARVKKAPNRPSTQIIEATSCIEMLIIMIKAKELSNFSIRQMLMNVKNW